MFFVRFENRTSSTRSSSGNGAGIGMSLYRGTILKGMLPKLKSSKYILVYRSSLGTFWYTLVLQPEETVHISATNKVLFRTHRGFLSHRHPIPLMLLMLYLAKAHLYSTNRTEFNSQISMQCIHCHKIEYQSSQNYSTLATVCYILLLVMAGLTVTVTVVVFQVKLVPSYLSITHPMILD